MERLAARQGKKNHCEARVYYLFVLVNNSCFMTFILIKAAK